MGKKEKEIRKPGIKKSPITTPKRRTKKELAPETWEKGTPGPPPKF